jgi:hypothetical protein
MARVKLERNLRLLELDNADRPDDPFTRFNLGWTLLDLGHTEEASPHGPARCSCRHAPAADHATATFTQWIGGRESYRQSHSSPPSRPIQSWPVVVPK